MRACLHLPPSIALIEAALQGLVAANKVLIETGVIPISPLDAGVRYQAEDSGFEDWNIGSRVVSLGHGDCEDLNGWECAGIQLEEDPDAQLIIVRTGRRRFHAVVELSSGEIVDVCPELGMGARDGVTIQGLPWLDAGEVLGARNPMLNRMRRAMRGGARPPRTRDQAAPGQRNVRHQGGKPSWQNQPQQQQPYPSYPSQNDVWAAMQQMQQQAMQQMEEEAQYAEMMEAMYEAHAQAQDLVDEDEDAYPVDEDNAIDVEWEERP